MASSMTLSAENYEKDGLSYRLAKSYQSYLSRPVYRGQFFVLREEGWQTPEILDAGTLVVQ